MKNLTFLIFLSLNFASLNAVGGDPDSEFDPAQGSVRISGVSYNGSGCPAGTLLSDISPDNEVITLIFSDYRVVKDPSSEAPVRKNCVMKFEIDSPQGWSHAVYSMSVQGYADLAEGLTGIQNLGYSYADGTGRNPLGRMEIPGAYRDDYVRSEDFSSNLDWSSCKKNRHQIVVNSAIAITPNSQAGKKALGLMTTDVVENVLDRAAPGKVTQQFGVVWKKCSDGTSPQKKKTFLGICKLQVTSAGKVIREVAVKARAGRQDQALQKVSRRADNRCKNISRRRAGNASCAVLPNTCKVISVDEG